MKTTIGGLNYQVPPPPDFNRLVTAIGSASGVTTTNTMEYVTIATLSNALDFGDLTAGLRQGAGGASSTRGIFAYGRNASNTICNNIEYITIASTGNAADFGDTTSSRTRLRPGGNSDTRACFAGGWTSVESSTNTDIIDYITIASTGNATDFGDLTVARSQGGGGTSTTRGVTFGGATNPSGVTSNVIDYITIASTGNSTDFGDLTGANRYQGGCGSSTRCVIMGALAAQTIQYITIASTGNATSFGNLITCSGAYCGTGGSTTRGIIAGGLNVGLSAALANIEYVTIATTGNSSVFGDLITSTTDGTSVSNCHGGL